MRLSTTCFSVHTCRHTPPPRMNSLTSSVHKVKLFSRGGTIFDKLQISDQQSEYSFNCKTSPVASANINWRQYQKSIHSSAYIDSAYFALWHTRFIFGDLHARGLIFASSSLKPAPCSDIRAIIRPLCDPPPGRLLKDQSAKIPNQGWTNCSNLIVAGFHRTFRTSEFNHL